VTQWTVGQKVAIAYHAGHTRSATVVKVGRKWGYLDTVGSRFRLETGHLDPDRGTVWPSASAYRAYVWRVTQWRRLQTYARLHKAPASLDTKALDAILETLKKAYDLGA
jgi:hypothetical protein